MLKNFTSIIEEAVDAGCKRGTHIFIESLEEDLNKSEIIAEHGFNNVVAGIYENSGYDVNADSDDDLDNINEDKLDRLLEELENETDD